MSTVETLVGDWLPLPDVAQLLDVSITKVHGLLDERALAALRIGERRIRSVPAAFLQDGHVVDSLKGTIVVLADAGFSDEELIGWLFTPDESLRGRPIDALREGRKTEIRRRAQSLAW
ncbi:MULTISPECIES: Rv2175c family DNA-binding protein [unclassified Arthrobacter]|uniref:Rv2175c family DNA-binding protein n=1 Tax=unclassified Arthrobacter TaxID=235627 RepID=UPI001EEF4D95|nr:Rv2175c family DNA-binding protein [Arthrobacter sp. FW305-BF8]UKA55998.1 DNA-binding protein [Arthrobacter sp. FW305-BF8]